MKLRNRIFLIAFLLALLLFSYYHVFGAKTYQIDAVSEEHEFSFNHLLPLVHSITFTIEGSIDGDATIQLGELPGLNNFTVDLKKGNIHVRNGGEWYRDTCYVKYKPKNVKRGTIKIRVSLRTPLTFI